MGGLGHSRQADTEETSAPARAPQSSHIALGPKRFEMDLEEDDNSSKLYKFLNLLTNGFHNIRTEYLCELLGQNKK